MRKLIDGISQGIGAQLHIVNDVVINYINNYSNCQERKATI